jgi:hypothetical protein
MRDLTELLLARRIRHFYILVSVKEALTPLFLQSSFHRGDNFTTAGFSSIGHYRKGRLFRLCAFPPPPLFTYHLSWALDFFL